MGHYNGILKSEGSKIYRNFSIQNGILSQEEWDKNADSLIMPVPFPECFLTSTHGNVGEMREIFKSGDFKQFMLEIFHSMLYCDFYDFDLDESNILRMGFCEDEAGMLRLLYAKCGSFKWNAYDLGFDIENCKNLPISFDLEGNSFKCETTDAVNCNSECLCEAINALKLQLDKCDIAFIFIKY